MMLYSYGQMNVACLNVQKEMTDCEHLNARHSESGKYFVASVSEQPKLVPHSIAPYAKVYLSQMVLFSVFYGQSTVFCSYDLMESYRYWQPASQWICRLCQAHLSKSNCTNIA